MAIKLVRLDYSLIDLTMVVARPFHGEYITHNGIKYYVHRVEFTTGMAGSMLVYVTEA